MKKLLLAVMLTMSLSANDADLTVVDGAVIATSATLFIATGPFMVLGLGIASVWSITYNQRVYKELT